MTSDRATRLLQAVDGAIGRMAGGESPAAAVLAAAGDFGVHAAELETLLTRKALGVLAARCYLQGACVPSVSPEDGGRDREPDPPATQRSRRRGPPPDSLVTA